MRDCDRYQEWLSACLDGELDERQETELRAHLDGCAECRDLYAAFTDLSLGISAEAEEEIPEDLHVRVMAKIDLSARVLNRQKKLRILRPVLTMAAGLVVVVGSVLALRGGFRGMGSAAPEAARADIGNTPAASYSIEMETPETAENALIDNMMVAAEPAEAPMPELPAEEAEDEFFAAASDDGARNGGDAENTATVAGGANAETWNEPSATAAPEEAPKEAERFDLLTWPEEITHAVVERLPGGETQTLRGPEQVALLIEYVNGLDLTPEETEDPSEYDGAAYILTFFRDDAELLRIIHFGNRWLRVDDGPWLRMNYDQAIGLEALLAELQ